MNETPNRPPSPEEGLMPPEQYLPQLDQEAQPDKAEKPPSPESARGKRMERPAQPPATSVPSPQQPSAGDDAAATRPAGNGRADDDMPVFANDVDVIEKEWVNKAKQIIKETRDDPYEQEKAMEQLQIDYLKKRYGRDVKPSK